VNTRKALVFVDPDTGLQTGNLSYRRRIGPEKYILDSELSALFGWLGTESILMIYQHLPRDKRRHDGATEKKQRQAQSVCNNELTYAYREDDLAFVFVTKSKEVFKQLQHFLINYHEKNMFKLNILKCDAGSK
jgi:hypothetical protein